QYENSPDEHFIIDRHQLRDQLPHGRPVFKAVPGAAAHEPDVRRRWVTVDDEVLVGRVFVLAHPGLDQRSALQAREPKREILPRRLQRLRRGYPLARGGVERWPAGVVGDLEPARSDE